MDKLREFFDHITQDFTESFGYPERPLLYDGKYNANLIWQNNFYTDPIFRHIHIEYYKTNKIRVIHANIFPNATVDMPILGLDFIEIGNKITGFFFDITPINTNQILQKNLIQFKHSIRSPERKLPEWANFFSENFICVTPLEEELDLLLCTSRAITREFLNYSHAFKDKYKSNIEKQNSYCRGQKQNDKTLKALSVDVGDENAKHFINNYMFPELLS
jgi:hypothetical protein